MSENININILRVYLKKENQILKYAFRNVLKKKTSYLKQLTIATSFIYNSCLVKLL